MHPFGEPLRDHRFLKWPIDLDLRLQRLGVTDFQARILRSLLSFWVSVDPAGQPNYEVWASGTMVAARAGASTPKTYAALRALARPTAVRPPLLGIVRNGTMRGDATVYTLRPLHDALAAIDVSDVFEERRLLVGTPDEGAI